MLELHIYGPAFGLPSIDVKCLAAIALLQTAFQPSQDVWKLIPVNNHRVSPFNELPALKDGDLWVCGFRNIATYFQCRYAEEISKNDLVLSLTDEQDADSEAFLSFLESRGIPLLDLSLYVSSDNYTNVTRSALSELLSWPQSWTIPQKLRDAARKRSEHLGLSGLDVDATREKELQKQNEGITAAIPQSLRLPKKSVTALLGSSAEQTRFRLEAVTSDFFEPLEKLLGKKNYFLGDRITTLDCFALAVLGQIRTEGMPQPWLREALEKYPNLWHWTKVNSIQVYGVRAQLPWANATERGWADFTLDVLDSIAESLPVTVIPTRIRAQDDSSWIHVDSPKSVFTKFERTHLFHLQSKKHQDALREVIAGGLSSAGLIGTLVYMGVLALNWPARRSQPTRQGFGEAGAFLGLR